MKRQVKMIYCDDETWEIAKELAKRYGLSVSGFIRVVIRSMAEGKVEENNGLAFLVDKIIKK